MCTVEVMREKYAERMRAFMEKVKHEIAGRGYGVEGPDIRTDVGYDVQMFVEVSKVDGGDSDCAIVGFSLVDSTFDDDSHPEDGDDDERLAFLLAICRMDHIADANFHWPLGSRPKFVCANNVAEVEAEFLIREGTDVASFVDELVQRSLAVTS